MRKKIFVDSDVILDLLAKRESFYEDAAQLFTLAHEKKIALFTTAVVFANVFYILRKVGGNEEAKKQLRNLRLLVHIVPIHENAVDMALNSKFSDFEDGLQYFTAKEHNMPALVTRNTGDYKVRDISIQTPHEFISMVNR
ncbi:MAG: PIN domain-containing protein [Treponema sp.]|jgi:predicted nucleic acid-binding protein|nr:PIN domain-containing protein [Treponema sp.]